MSIEERRALLGDVDPAPRAAAPVRVVTVAFALAAAGGVATSAWLWTRLDGERDALRASEARLAAESVARAQESAEAAKRLAAVEIDLGSARLAAKDAEDARERTQKASDALIASFLRSSQVELGGSTTTLAREVMRGGTLDDLARTLPEEKYLAVALAVVEALAREPSAAGPSELARDITFAAGFAARAKAVLDPASPTLGDALHAAAQLIWSGRRLAFVDGRTAAALGADAAKVAVEAREARKAAGGRRLALTLVLLAEIDRAAKRLPEAARLLADADLEVLKDGTPLEVAAVERELAEVEFELGRTQQAIDLLDARAKALSAIDPRELPQAPIAALGLRELRMRMLAATGVEKSDAQRWLSEQVVLARAQLAAGRHAPVAEALPAVLVAYRRDQSRFRERLECALLLARAMDALGSPKAAYETLDQRQFVDDARVLGVDHPLAKEFEAMRAELGARR
ncbi:MAG: hypothetical protein RL325_1857 [Planctomycetota bacterium]